MIYILQYGENTKIHGISGCSEMYVILTNIEFTALTIFLIK